MAAKIFLDLPGGIKMPALGIGTWQSSNPAELETALNAALEAGYRHIDTAYAYQNEAVIGKVLKEWFSAGKLKREELFITTKLPMPGIHPDRVETYMKKSLENLQLDYVDLYLVHFTIGFQWDPKTLGPKLDKNGSSALEGKTDHVGIWKKMEEQVDAGRTKTIGLSNYNVAQIEAVLKSARIKPANLQIEMHVFLQQRNLVEFCKKNGITVVAYAPLGTPGYNTFMKNVGMETKELPDILQNATIAKIAKKHSKTPAQIAIRFLLQVGVAPIPKSVNPKRVLENIDVFNFNLDPEDMKALKNLEVGPAARVCDFGFKKEIATHPDFPFNSY